MDAMVFRVEFLSDIVLPATSNTEGNIKQLDFIPGSNFLGMAAKEYGEYEDSFAVFHSGAVRFGDATILDGEELTYKMPLSFFYEKLDDSIIVNQIHKSLEGLNQAKQHRKGFITKDLSVVHIEYNYTQKSGYDRGKRRSKDGSMYGYEAIRSGTQWLFAVRYDSSVSSKDIERIRKNLIGKKRLGKSKSSEYGEVEISERESLEIPENSTRGREVVLYAKSRLALIDSEGRPTYDLACLAEGISDENINWARTHLMVSGYSPYNRARETKESERIVINSGSVIILNDVDDETVTSIQSGVGTYLSEGFGEVLVNPSFLDKGGIEFKSNDTEPEIDKKSIDDGIALFLQKREEEKRTVLDLADSVDAFIKENRSLYSNINRSQWGTIRSICSSGSRDFRSDIRDYISSGKVEWSRNQIEKLLESEPSLEYIKLIAAEMPKRKEKEVKNGK